MYLSTPEAVRLLTEAMEPKTAAQRLRASAKVLRQLSRIAAGPDVPFEAYREQYLRDCLEAGAPEKALVLLEIRCSANQMKELLEPAVALYLAMGK